MIILYALCVAVVSVTTCSAIPDESMARQLAYLTEKMELIIKENEVLKNRVDDLSKENADIKARLQFIEQAVVISSEDINDPTFNEPTRYETQQHEEADALREGPDLTTAQKNSEAIPSFKMRKENSQSKTNANTVTMHRRLLLSPSTLISSNTTKVAFTAILTTSLPLGLHQTVEYDKVITNVGNAYDPRHGHFTAPTRAVYLMACTAMNRNGGNVFIDMVKNGIRIGHLYGGNSDYNMGTQVSIVLLEKGDMVWVRHGSGNSETLHNDEYNTFSGTILFEI